MNWSASTSARPSRDGGGRDETDPHRAVRRPGSHGQRSAADDLVHQQRPASAPAPPLATRAASQSVVVGGDWPAFHAGGALTGQAADLGPPPMRLRWTYRTDDADPAGVLASAAIASNCVYVADHKGGLHAIDLATGHRRWVSALPTALKPPRSFFTTPFIWATWAIPSTRSPTTTAGSNSPSTRDAIHSSANIIAGHIVFGADSSEIFCLDPAGLKPVWKCRAGDRINGAPAAAGAAGREKHLRRRMRLPAARAVARRRARSGFTVDLGALCPGSPAVCDGKIILGTDGGRVVCIDAATHQRLWVFDKIEHKAMVFSSPAVAQGTVVVGARDRNVWAIDLATGKERWRFATRGDVDSSPAIAGPRVYVGSKDKHLYVLDLHTGSELWSFAAARAISGFPRDRPGRARRGRRGRVGLLPGTPPRSSPAPGSSCSAPSDFR